MDHQRITDLWLIQCPCVDCLNKDWRTIEEIDFPLNGLWRVDMMIVVDGDELPLSSSPSSQSQPQGFEILSALMEHPTLVSASNSFKDMPARIVSTSGDSKCVYIFQREYATVNPTLIAGTDEATTCIGLIIRNPQSGMTSIAHMDSPDVVDIGLTQMLSLVVDTDSQPKLDVYFLGGYDDTTPEHVHHGSRSQGQKMLDGYSLPLCLKIVEAMWKRPEIFHVRLLFVLGHNTRRDTEGIAHPVHTGFLVETATGSVKPACFASSSRCPDEIVRRIRVTACNDDQSWWGKLLETYDTSMDKFRIAPCAWSRRQFQIALALQHLPDSEILPMCSTSPYAEGPDFVDNLRRQWEYLINNPDWRQFFPKKLPRIFERTNLGGWIRCHQHDI